MKTKEQLFNDFFTPNHQAQNIKYDIMLVIKYAQEDAYKAGINDLLENSDGLDFVFQAEKLLKAASF